jgi:hypothetical protein
LEEINVKVTLSLAIFWLDPERVKVPSEKRL